MKSKKVQLDELNRYWQENCTCGLKKTTKQAVFGDGNPNAEIVFIGEAPGKKEDNEGKPFIGAAGKFLSEMLNEINIKRKDIYITNIVKYRPPDNRDPSPEEKEDCSEWLKNELKIIKPKIIVLLGIHSMGRFFPKKKISEVHGKIIKTNNSELRSQTFLILYHPAVALYNRKLKETLVKDFKKIPKILNRLKKI